MSNSTERIVPGSFLEPTGSRVRDAVRFVEMAAAIVAIRAVGWVLDHARGEDG